MCVLGTPGEYLSNGDTVPVCWIPLALCTSFDPDMQERRLVLGLGHHLASALSSVPVCLGTLVCIDVGNPQLASVSWYHLAAILENQISP